MTNVGVADDTAFNPTFSRAILDVRSCHDNRPYRLTILHGEAIHVSSIFGSQTADRGTP
ncbi:MAG: hypothetical protein VX745_10465 [Pseudomonadota bacterium]|nr:hypothetical protein [Pseudomonadota bacterium]